MRLPLIIFAVCIFLYFKFENLFRTIMENICQTDNGLAKVWYCDVDLFWFNLGAIKMFLGIVIVLSLIKIFKAYCNQAPRV